MANPPSEQPQVPDPARPSTVAETAPPGRGTAQPTPHERPWGYFVELEQGTGYKVKRIVVHPGKRLSLQRHRHRSEHWLVVSGRATVVRGSHQVRLDPGYSIDIPTGTLHRLANSGEADMALIEVQLGDYLEEDDIERLEDDYGRS